MLDRFIDRRGRRQLLLPNLDENHVTPWKMLASKQRFLCFADFMGNDEWRDNPPWV